MDEKKRSRQNLKKSMAEVDNDIRAALDEYITKVLELYDSGGGSFSVNTAARLMSATKRLEEKVKGTVEDGTVIAVDFAKKDRAAEFRPYLDEARRLLLARGLTRAQAEAATTLSNIVPLYGGGLDRKVIDAVWYKVWPDRLNVDDRIRKLGLKTQMEVQRVMKEGIAEGMSARRMALELEEFIAGGQKAAFRLAAHTINMTYQTAQAEISIGAKFVMGVRIVRGMYGNASETCEICEEHGGPADGEGKEYFKDDFGGADIDMFVMANAPAYHSYCNCGIETIYEPAEQFVKNALSGLDEGRESYEGYKFGGDLHEQLDADKSRR